MNSWRALSIAFLTAALPACILSPGQHMSTLKIGHSGSAESSRYNLVPITGKEIAMERAVESAATIPQDLLAFQPEPYRIGVGDSLYITVWDHPELSSPAGPQQQSNANGRLVRPDGSMYYPYAGIVPAVGLTVEQLRASLAKKLAPFVEKPQVDVSVISYGAQRITIRGAFVKTDPQPITVAPLTLAQSVGAATIDPTNADLSNLTLIRDGHAYHLDLDALSRSPHGLDEVWMKAGDQIFLPYNDRKEVYVIGEVNRPLAIPFKTSSLNLTQVLGRAGGLSQTTSKGRAVYVIRGVEDMEKEPATIYQLNADSPASFVLASEFTVRPGDVVFVGAADITRWNRFLTQLLPSGGLLQNAATAKYDLTR
jgi:polysaccharide export outer membrane protein